MKKSSKPEISKKKKSGKFIRFFGLLLIIAGLMAAGYPLLTQYLYRFKAQEDVTSFRSNIKNIDDAEIDRRILLARAYNDLLQGTEQSPEDPYLKEVKETAVKEYARMLEVKEKIGIVKIPKIAEELPVFAGTDESVLQKGVGHMEGSSLPIGGNGTHAVLTAHTGLPTARLFTDIDKLEIGDRFYYQNIKETLAYQVVSKEVVLPNQGDSLKIDPAKDQMTLLTCTPYMVNSHRLLVHGQRVDYLEQVERKDLEDSKSSRNNKRLLHLSYVLLVFALLFSFLIRRRIRKLERMVIDLKGETGSKLDRGGDRQ